MNPRLFPAVTKPCVGLLLGLLASSASLCAQNVTYSSSPLGSFNIPLAGASDNYASLPLQRTPAIAAAVQSVSESGNTAIITLAPPTALTPSQFVYVAGSQPNTYFVQFMTGNKEGYFYTVTANDGSTITVDSNGDTSLPGDVIPGDQINVVPYWTLNTTFPNGQGLYPSNSTSSPQSLVMLPNLTKAGINLPVAASYYYYTGNGTPGWKLVGDTSSNTYPDVVLSPDTYFIVRHPLATANTTLMLLGAVPMSKQAIIVNNLKALTRQDNAVALPVPEDVTLLNSNLYPAVISGSATLSPMDSLLVFSPGVIKQNKSATAVYFYYTGSANGGPGWRKTGDATTIRNNDLVLAAGQGFIIRRGPRLEPVTAIWLYLPTYLQ
ncbi:MAG: TIGR02597 family protein [Opitutales bacterium]|jgi:uncharacterized protein (TIGR02597 family)